MPRIPPVCVGAEQLAAHLKALLASHDAMLAELKRCLDICERGCVADAAPISAAIAKAEGR
jgi:hypothetical protein